MDSAPARSEAYSASNKRVQQTARRARRGGYVALGAAMLRKLSPSATCR